MMGNSGDTGAATSIPLGYPFAVAEDSSGNVYIADSVNARIRKVASNGIMTTYAGTGVAGCTGDTGAATSVQLYSPYGVTVDTNGIVYIADTANAKVRTVSTSGIMTTYAGGGTYASGCTGDTGAATSIKLDSPYTVCVDSSGNLFITEPFMLYRVRKVTTNGIITTYAGSGGYGYSGDGGQATSATFRTPYGIAVNSVGTLFIVDAYNYVIRMVTRDGIITTFAGTAGVYGSTGGSTGDGGAPTSCVFQSLRAVAVDSLDRVYVTDANKIRVIGNMFACPAGSYVTSTSSGTCSSCPMGSYSASTSLATSCTLCAANMYMSSTGATVCTVCPAGTMNFVFGSTSVASCTVREYSCLCMFDGRFLFFSSQNNHDHK